MALNQRAGGRDAQGEILVTVDGAPLELSDFAGGSEPLADGTRSILPAVTDEATAGRLYQRFRWDVIASIRGGPLGAGGRRRPRPSGVGGGHGRGRRPGGGGELSARRLLGAHLPAAFPERRETVSGECLGCWAQFAIDVRLPLPVVYPDCGVDVLGLAQGNRLDGEVMWRLQVRKPKTIRQWSPSTFFALPSIWMVHGMPWVA